MNLAQIAKRKKNIFLILYFVQFRLLRIRLQPRNDNKNAINKIHRWHPSLPYVPMLLKITIQRNSYRFSLSLPKGMYPHGWSWSFFINTKVRKIRQKWISSHYGSTCQMCSRRSPYDRTQPCPYVGQYKKCVLGTCGIAARRRGFRKPGTRRHLPFSSRA